MSYVGIYYFFDLFLSFDTIIEVSNSLISVLILCHLIRCLSNFKSSNFKYSHLHYAGRGKDMIDIMLAINGILHYQCNYMKLWHSIFKTL